jgi:hypothetical protein
MRLPLRPDALQRALREPCSVWLTGEVDDVTSPGRLGRIHDNRNLVGAKGNTGCPRDLTHLGSLYSRHTSRPQRLKQVWEEPRYGAHRDIMKTQFRPSFQSWLAIAVAASTTLALPGCWIGIGDITGEISTEGEGEEEAPAEGEGLFDRAGGSACEGEVVPAQELLITNLHVVEDPVRTTWSGCHDARADGAWQFGRIMADMAGDNDPAIFVQEWLEQWGEDQCVNGFTALARPKVRELLLDTWPRTPDGKLDLTKAPLRLLAIVNRADLRDLAAHKAGEGRFVFGVLNDKGEPVPFTIILEFNLPATTNDDVIAWAAAWHVLSKIEPGTDAFNEALQQLTDKFSRRGLVASKPNGSAISQVRTNEVALAAPWELREFGLDATGSLVEQTVVRTPDRSLEGTKTLADFINANEASILAEQHEVPLQFAGAPFRANAISNRIDVWTAPGIANNEARHKFSLNTCNGCHGAETGTIFLHVKTREAGKEAELSPFMTGTTVVDKVSGETRAFNELGRRGLDFKALLCAKATPDHAN